ncbi:hypothetical protein ACFQ08_06420, partial [Streptosporangium algeriense]
SDPLAQPGPGLGQRGPRQPQRLFVVADQIGEGRQHPVDRGGLLLAPSLEEFGQLADPPLTKDAIAGRIRRLLAMADKRAQDIGIPNTEANLTVDMLAP